jgi:hypothetical protein
MQMSRPLGMEIKDGIHSINIYEFLLCAKHYDFQKNLKYVNYKSILAKNIL